MTSARNGCHFENNFCTILLVLSQVFCVPSFMVIAASHQELSKDLGGGGGGESGPSLG